MKRPPPQGIFLRTQTLCSTEDQKVQKIVDMGFTQEQAKRRPQISVWQTQPWLALANLARSALEKHGYDETTALTLV